MSNQIPEETIESIRKSNDIVDVVGEYVQLKKQGKNFFGLCPFHGENTPSFSVTQEKQIFHCFGCGKGGNVITFMMEMEGFSFFEALKYLAAKTGISLPESTMQQENSISKENQDILSAYEWLTKLYNHLLRHAKDGKEGYAYFKGRGLTDETIDQFKLGFAPNVNDFTKTFLEKKGFHSSMLVKAGLLSLNDDHSITDSFRGRVIYPIRNHIGKTIAFAGRTITEQGPKYLNSSESELFQKGRLLYNFDLAKKHIRKQNEAVLFEGYMDVISAYQAGVRNSIATMGTALTESQAKLLRRYVDTVVICFDADQAGLDGAYKAAAILQNAGCLVKVANVGEGLDPDGYIQEYGAEAFQKHIIDASDTYMSFFMRYIKKDYNVQVEGDRFQYIEVVLKRIALIESPVEREYYVQELAKEYDLSADTLLQEVQAYRQQSVKVKDNREKDRYTNKTNHFIKPKRLLPAFHNAERQLIAYMLQDASIADKVQREIGVDFNIEMHKVIATYLYAFYEEGKDADVSLFIERLTDETHRKYISEIAMIPIYGEITDKEINDYIRIIRSENKDLASMRHLKQQQKLAEQQDDPMKAAEIAMQIILLKKQMKEHY
ncbi:DNA primase [Ornithinibacillus gellani]|uniref:DNA primase n=1 Tax=Ornithinibacillus gellani TaxID=2293253 RepID=UPI000F49B636|nr:DNA primase [Ornithinibacillus gellani]TQS74567.1 DNA primase [Ornithinibacillus gellani]